MASISNFILSLPTSLFSSQSQQQQQDADEIVNTEQINTDITSSSMTDTNLPITGICIISKIANVPTGYHCIHKSKRQLLISKIISKILFFP